MTETTTKAIKKSYDEALAALQGILFAQTASKAEKTTAKAALSDLTATMLAQNLRTVEGRTALLSALIVELQQTIDSIKVDSKIAAVADKLTGLVAKAKDLFKKEKEDLV